MEKRKATKLFYLFILFLWICFIFSNSLRPGSASNEQSDFVTGSLNDLLSLFDSSLFLSGTFVRMLAHVGEFFILGVLLCLWVPLFQKKGGFPSTAAFLSQPFYRAYR